MSNTFFENSMNPTEKQACQIFKNMVDQILGNDRQPHYKEIVPNFLYHSKSLGCNMSIRLHILQFTHRLLSADSGLCFWRTWWKILPEHMGSGKKISRWWTVNVMADCCWLLKRDGTSVTSCRRKAERRTFHPSLEVNCKWQWTNEWIISVFMFKM